MRYLSYIVFCLLSFVMCTEQPKELLPELSYAESLMQRFPDSALAVLDSMEVPSPSDKFQYATWCLLITQARDKNYVKHTSDSLINIALTYFEKQDNPVRKATALYYEGRVNHDLNNAEEATDYYLRARDAAKNTTDYRLLCLINIHLGTLYAYRGLADLALKAYENAYDYSIQLKDSTLISNSYSCLGRVSTLNNDWTKGLDYYKKAIGIAEQAGSLKALTLAYGEISTVYSVLSMLDSSMYYLKKSKEIKEINNTSALSQTYLGIGETYYFMGESDSAYFYLEKALNTTNIYTKCNAIQILYYLYRDLGKYEDAIKYNEQYWVYNDSIDTINRCTKIAEIQAKYDKEKMQNKNNQLEITERNNEILGCSVLLILLIIIIIIVYVYRKKLINRIHEIENIKKELDSHLARIHENDVTISQNQHQIDSLSLQVQNSSGLEIDLNNKMLEIKQLHQDNVSLQSQNRRLEGDIEKFKMDLREKGRELETYGHVVLENTRLHDREKYLCIQLINHIEILNNLKSDPKYIEESQWPEIFDSMNIVYPNLIDRLRKDFSLTDSDLWICCLIKLQFSNSTMARVIAVAPSSVTKRKQRLKERINQHLKTPLEGEMSIEAYLWKY
ncbi:tetratricopeptide repeat protein [Parabacteroides faecis]|uniref:tetratricopeptide repeat protein n=2 Tax=Parabacteroides faecis TaxID=1217282 RepID=UPI002164CE50|nr:tetratricopeptide repeat protein [Parabacteroides faecis]UVQ45825.1 tetratricopeptide repeat protein [Parabacteroides faecis]